jgi:hypothetical protein
MKTKGIVRGGLGVAACVTMAGIILSTGGPSSVTVRRVALRRHAPAKIHEQRNNGSWTSYNWSGYAVTNSTVGAVTDVKGSWVVPTATCPAGSNGYSSFWVGIDGFSSNTVEQTGTDSDCVSLNGKTGTPTYYAWFEFYPAGGYLIGFPRAITPGDQMTAEVKYAGTSGGPRGRPSGPQFTITITDVSKNESYSFTQSVSGAQQTSAEWIAEAPCCETVNGKQAVLPLADFGLMSFSNGTATVKGTTGSIASFGSADQEITMIGEFNTSLLKAQPSGVSGGGFSDQWFATGP